MTHTHWWPADYFASRAKFIDVANDCGASTQSYGVEPIGPNGQPLSVDVAAFVSSEDEHRIVVTSGVHGVEGFIGAAIQVQALQALKQRGLPPRTGVVMIHAVNPWGYAHLRRVDENNIDINRNFIDYDTTQPTSPNQYATLDPIINPRSKPSAKGEAAYWLSASKLIAQQGGITKLVKPIAQGQCDYPQGVFFGGKAPTPSRTLLETLIQHHSDGVERVTVLDIHSGLGPNGIATLISNTNLIEPQNQISWLKERFNNPLIADEAEDNAYDALGAWSRWCKRELHNKAYLYLCVEIGTVNPIKLFSALRRENQAHHWADNNSREYGQTKQALRNVFAPRSAQWQQKAIAQGMDVFERALDRLS